VTDVDNRAVPGTYEKTATGYVRLDEPTQPAPAAVADMAVEDAQAIIDASEASGFPPPPQAVAVIEAAAAAQAATARAAAEAEAEARRLARQSSKPTPSAGETKE
jgi:hypothetical protein